MDSPSTSGAQRFSPNADEFDYAFKGRNFAAMRKLILEKRVNLNDDQKLYLHSAITEDDAAMAEFILQNGGDPNIRDSTGRTPLHPAILKCSPKLLEILLKHNADLMGIEKFTGRSALDLAMRQKSWLLEENVPLEWKKPFFNNNVIIYLILKYGMNSIDENQSNYFKLCDAILKNELETAKKLVEERKDVSKMPLELAVLENSVEMAELMLAKGANPNENQTMIFLAINSKNFEMVKLLCKYKTNLNVEDKDYFSPLCRAVEKGFDWVKLLIDHGADLYFSVNALHQACVHGKLDVVKLLVQNHVDVNRRIGSKNTPLHEAVGSPEIVEYLLDNGAEVNAKNSWEHTPLDLASRLVSFNPEAAKSVKILEDRGGQRTKVSSKPAGPSSDGGSEIFVVDFKFNKGIIMVDAKRKNGELVSFTCEYEKFKRVLGAKEEDCPIQDCVKRLQLDSEQFLREINSNEGK